MDRLVSSFCDLEIAPQHPHPDAYKAYVNELLDRSVFRGHYKVESSSRTDPHLVGVVEEHVWHIKGGFRFTMELLVPAGENPECGGWFCVEGIICPYRGLLRLREEIHHGNYKSKINTDFRFFEDFACRDIQDLMRRLTL
jgi:hypothetical protein